MTKQEAAKEYRKRWLLTPAGKAYLRRKYERRYARPDARAKMLADSKAYQLREKEKRSVYTKRWRTESEAGKRYYARQRMHLTSVTTWDVVEARLALSALKSEIMAQSRK